MKRTSINPSQWGLAYKMDQGEVLQGTTRHLRCSGQVALKEDPDSDLGVSVECPGDIVGQMGIALSRIDEILEQADMTRANVVSLRFFTTDMDGFLANYEVYSNWISEAGTCPPQSLLGIDRLVLPELLVEIEAEASA